METKTNTVSISKLKGFLSSTINYKSEGYTLVKYSPTNFDFYKFYDFAHLNSHNQSNKPDNNFYSCIVPIDAFITILKAEIEKLATVNTFEVVYEHKVTIYVIKTVEATDQKEAIKLFKDDMVIANEKELFITAIQNGDYCVDDDYEPYINSTHRKLNYAV